MVLNLVVSDSGSPHTRIVDVKGKHGVARSMVGPSKDAAAGGLERTGRHPRNKL